MVVLEGPFDPLRERDFSSSELLFSFAWYDQLEVRFLSPPASTKPL